MLEIDIDKSLRTLAKLVVDERNRRHMNQEQFADLLGVSQATIFKLENARYDRLPKHDTLIAITKILKMNYWELIKHLENDFEIEEEKPPTKREIASLITQVVDFNTSFDIAAIAVAHSKELKDRQ